MHELSSRHVSQLWEVFPFVFFCLLFHVNRSCHALSSILWLWSALLITTDGPCRINIMFNLPCKNKQGNSFSRFVPMLACPHVVSNPCHSHHRNVWCISIGLIQCVLSMYTSCIIISYMVWIRKLYKHQDPSIATFKLLARRRSYQFSAMRSQRDIYQHIVYYCIQTACVIWHDASCGVGYCTMLHT